MELVLKINNKADRRTVVWNKNRDVSTGPLAHPFACSLVALTRLLAPRAPLSSAALHCPPLRSLVRSLAPSLVEK